METIELEFYECEHEGDLQGYLDQLPKNIKVISTSINQSAETGTAIIQVPDKKAFWDEFRKTDAYDFLN